MDPAFTEDEQAFATYVRKKRPHHVPVILHSNVELKKQKIFVPVEMTVGKFLAHVRVQLAVSLRPSEGLYVMGPKNTMLSSSSLMGLVDDEFASKNEFLHLHVMKENMFGC